jgi:outer membrane receptor protein involved in Fe transport
VPMGANKRLTFLADIFNLFDQTRVTSYDQNTQLTYPNVNPDFGKPVNSILSGTPPQFQAPRNIRLGVRFEF